MGIPPKATKSNNASGGQALKSCGPFYKGGETTKTQWNQGREAL